MNSVINSQPLRTGAAAGPVVAPVWFMPLDSRTWSNPYVTYSFNEDQKKRGLFHGTQGATFYAPESSTITPLPDGGFILTAHGEDNDREWIGGYIDGISQMFAQNESVRAGQPLGRLSRDLILVLKVTQKGTEQFEFIDPVDVLQRYGARFQDLEGAAHNLPKIAGAAGPSTELATSAQPGLPAGVPSASEALDVFKSTPKPQFTAMHMAMGVGAGALLGFLITRAFRKGR